MTKAVMCIQEVVEELLQSFTLNRTSWWKALGAETCSTKSRARVPGSVIQTQSINSVLEPIVQDFVEGTIATPSSKLLVPRT
jgi:hypothetical protein